jgi:hypothetical protein
MESLIRSFEVISLSRSGVQLLHNPIAIVLGDVRHALALRWVLILDRTSNDILRAIQKNLR